MFRGICWGSEVFSRAAEHGTRFGARVYEAQVGVPTCGTFDDARSTTHVRRRTFDDARSTCAHSMTRVGRVTRRARMVVYGRGRRWLFGGFELSRVW